MVSETAPFAVSTPARKRAHALEVRVEHLRNTCGTPNFAQVFQIGPCFNSRLNPVEHLEHLLHTYTHRVCARSVRARIYNKYCTYYLISVLFYPLYSAVPVPPSNVDQPRFVPDFNGKGAAA